MRTFVHVVLLICGIAVAVGSFMSILAGVKPGDVRLEDLRDGFPAGWVIEQIADQSVPFYRSMMILLLGSAVAILIAAVFGSRLAAWAGVIVGLATLGTFYYRANDQFDNIIRENYSTILTNQTGFILTVGGLALALLMCLVPRENARR
ncbi:hypothetical protein FFI94_005310 [Rhodococcus sp. KBS0724]|jgi:hypothetical protein|uniref:hypothetical protein n=1 Tax=Rhodococcus sp. KBS0724 TaxID=1179674 RepID=UPI00110F23B2|nr:hypothetical protein [Rhodococcus sp. KBS0724]TSD45646.1 hypothetical protein FFI94_005310 [Rhodococcus sp. KBS0724]